jgi:aquaporin Z
VLNHWASWWAYLVGPMLGAAIAVGIAHLLRGPGGGAAGTAAAQGTLGTQWVPGRIGTPSPAPLAGDMTAGERPAPDPPSPAP